MGRTEWHGHGHVVSEAGTTEGSASKLAEGLTRWRDTNKRTAAVKSISPRQEDPRFSSETSESVCVC